MVESIPKGRPETLRAAFFYQEGTIYGMARQLSVAVCAVLALTAACTAEPAGSETTDDGLGKLASQKLAWQKCRGEELAETGAECATVKAPMDYDKPDGKQIEVAIARIEATDGERRRGVLLTNPGGPGSPGLSLVEALSGQPSAEVYDTIAMDPRGTGQSTNLFCDEFETPDRSDRPETKQDLKPYFTAAKKEEAACEKGGGELREHITTMNTARDMDLIRRVLGEKKISFLGYSYGNVLGPVYGQMFPEHLDRTVYDSATDPAQTWREQERAGVEATERNVAAWTKWVSERDGTFGLGDSEDEVRQVLDLFATTLADRELGDLADVTTFDNAIGTGTRYRLMWPGFAWALADLLPALDGGEVDAAAAQQLAGLESSEDASILSRKEAEDERPNGTYQAIICDWEWPLEPDEYFSGMLEVAKDNPYGDSVSRVGPSNCTFNTDHEKMVEIGERRYPAGLVVQGEGDTQTAYSGGVALAKQLDMPLIAVLNSGIHGYYPDRENTCVNDVVNAYLVDGKLPDGGVECAAVADALPDIPTDDSGDGPASRKDSPTLPELLKKVS